MCTDCALLLIKRNSRSAQLAPDDYKLIRAVYAVLEYDGITGAGRGAAEAEAEAAVCGGWPEASCGGLWSAVWLSGRLHMREMCHTHLLFTMAKAGTESKKRPLGT